MSCSLSFSAKRGALCFSLLLLLLSNCQGWIHRAQLVGRPLEVHAVPPVASRTFRTNRRSTTILGTTTALIADTGILDVDTFPIVPLLVITSAVLLISSQGFINQQLGGDRGLGAFLKDGSGFSGSGFRPLSAPSDSERALSGEDPLPWLSLPKLDFVEVAGQDEEPNVAQGLLEELEALRIEMNEQLKLGNVQEASLIRSKLEHKMQENDLEYN